MKILANILIILSGFILGEQTFNKFNPWLGILFFILTILFILFIFYKQFKKHF